MKIQSSQVHMQSHQVSVRRIAHREELTVWKRTEEQRGQNQHEELNMQAAMKSNPLDNIIETEQAEIDEFKLMQFKFSLLKVLIERLTGKSIDVYDAEELSASIEKIGKENQGIPSNSTGTNNRPAYGVIYRRETSKYEAEKVDFNLQARVITQDGEEIEIDIDISMQYEMLQSEELEIRAGDAKRIDPIVINFDGKGIELTQRQFSFDIDLDGEQDNIAFTTPGSGFLAVDENLNGYIDDGSELFGPESGHGFDELNDYDDDGNMFLDEQDQIFSALKVWVKDQTGSDRLLALGEVGIEAIYLGYVDSQLQLVDKKETVVGHLTGNSFYIDDNGEAGLVQEVDLLA